MRISFAYVALQESHFLSANFALPWGRQTRMSEAQPIRLRSRGELTGVSASMTNRADTIAAKIEAFIRAEVDPL